MEMDFMGFVENLEDLDGRFSDVSLRRTGGKSEGSQNVPGNSRSVMWHEVATRRSAGGHGRRASIRSLRIAEKWIDPGLR